MHAIVDTLKLVQTWIAAGALPTTFTTLKLAEAHGYFHTNPGALTFLNGSWYTSLTQTFAGLPRVGKDQDAKLIADYSRPEFVLAGWKPNLEVRPK